MSERLIELVTGFSWRGAHPDQHPVLYLQGPDGNERVVELRGEFDFEKQSTRRCIGFRKSGQRVLCPDDATPPKAGAVQCGACERVSGFKACMICTGWNCPPLAPEARAWCESVHHLYVACFGSAKVKVGTASDPRRLKRLLDQGPLAAAWIASGPGPIIKRLESLVVGLGYAESMRRSEKQRLLTSAMDEEEAQKRLRDALDDIHERIDLDRLGASSPFHPLEFAPRPDMAIAARQHERLEAMDPVAGRHLGGRILGASGSFLVLDDGAAPCTLDLRGLGGWLVCLAPKGPRWRRVSQMALF